MESSLEFLLLSAFLCLRSSVCTRRCFSLKVAQTVRQGLTCQMPLQNLDLNFSQNFIIPAIGHLIVNGGNALHIGLYR